MFHYKSSILFSSVQNVYLFGNILFVMVCFQARRQGGASEGLSSKKNQWSRTGLLHFDF
jgi:hypothetical protein